jgi:hypothetical protein
MRPAILAVVLALAACGPSPKRPTTPVTSNAWVDEDSDDGDELVCQDERMTGTNLSKVVCRTQEEIDEERNAAMMWETHPRNNTRVKHF